MKMPDKKFIAEAANIFNQLHGRAKIDASIKSFCPELAKHIADAYHQLKHNPASLMVKISYHSFKQDLKEQWDFVTQKVGIVCEPWHKIGQPYPTSKKMIEDIQCRKHLYFYQGGDMPLNHPLSAIDSETGYSYNCLLRAVHDIFGHAAHNFQFGPRGEENAYHLHCQMFHPESIPALTSETRGQNCWVNFGPHLRNAKGEIPQYGEEGYILPCNRPYAAQKAGLLPRRFNLTSSHIKER
jgi:hypothetical protein